MTDISDTIQAKSDQLNADDLIGREFIDILITATKRDATEQPVSLSYQGDNGKPYKPCLSMRRVLVYAWGKDSSNYVGRTLRLYRDPSIKWGKEEVGGLRISHLSHMKAPLTVPLTVKQGTKKMFTVHPLEVQAPAPRRTLSDEEKAAAAKKKADEVIAAIAKAETAEDVNKVFADNAEPLDRLQANYLPEYERVTDARDFKIESFASQA
jgi:hypothetical protein